jgi:hypothetical protein
MKKLLFLLSTLICIYAVAQIPALEQYASNANKTASFIDVAETPDLRKLDYKAFKPGEKLEYVMHYGLINAGIAKIEILDEGRKIAGRKVYHVVGIGESTGAFDWFYKVRDRYETYIDADGVFPWLFVRRVDEGGFKFSQDYKFMQHKNQVDNGKGKTFETPDYTQDMISAVYFARTLDMTKVKPGDIISMETFVDNEVWPAKVRFVGTETISTKAGKFECYKFNPIVQRGRVFKNESDMNVYITKDENKIPVLVEAKVLVGSIKMEITKYEGVANPMAKLK